MSTALIAAIDQHGVGTQELDLVRRPSDFDENFGVKVYRQRKHGLNAQAVFGAGRGHRVQDQSQSGLMGVHPLERDAPVQRIRLFTIAVACPHGTVSARDAQEPSIIAHRLDCGVEEWSGRAVGVEVDDIKLVRFTGVAIAVAFRQIIGDRAIHESEGILVRHSDDVLQAVVVDIDLNRLGSRLGEVVCRDRCDEWKFVGIAHGTKARGRKSVKDLEGWLGKVGRFGGFCC